jgi:hypothetical protein
MKYSDKLKDPRWQKKRLEVFERDGWCCQCCGDSESPLLAEAFHSICMLYPPDVTANIIHHALKTREIMEFMSNKLFESIKVKTV